MATALPVIRSPSLWRRPRRLISNPARGKTHRRTISKPNCADCHPFRLFLSGNIQTSSKLDFELGASEDADQCINALFIDPGYIDLHARPDPAMCRLTAGDCGGCQRMACVGWNGSR